MSRTYRKTSTKQGHPRSWGVRHMATMDHTKTKKPKPYTVKSGLYENITETIIVTYAGDNPWWTYRLVKWDIEFVNKGVPLAIQEYQENTWMRIPTGRWYKKPTPQTVSRTYRKYLGINPEYNWDHQSKVWNAERLFDHVCRNRTGGRSRAMERSIKRCKSRERRLEGKEFIRTYAHEDHIWHDDFTYEDDDWYDEIPDNWNFWEDEIESKIDDPYNGYDSWDYDRTDYEYDYWTY